MFIHEIQCFLKCSFNEHFLLIGYLATNLRILETVIFALSMKIDAHEYK